MVDRLSDVWKTDTGYKVRVQLMDAPDISQEAEFLPKRIALVKKTPLVHAGTVISRLGYSFLLVSQSTLSDMQRFRALEITDHLEWKRNFTVIDEVSRMEIDKGVDVIHTALPVVVEPLRTVKELGFERPKRTIYTGAAVKVGDFVGEYEVHNVIEALGVRIRCSQREHRWHILRFCYRSNRYPGRQTAGTQSTVLL